MRKFTIGRALTIVQPKAGVNYDFCALRPIQSKGKVDAKFFFDVYRFSLIFFALTWCEWTFNIFSPNAHGAPIVFCRTRLVRYDPLAGYSGYHPRPHTG